MRIIEDNLESAAVAALLQKHLLGMARHSPPDSIHALDIEALRADDITFWTAWEGQELLGCGALKQLDARHGEIKSMRTASSYLRRGVAAGILSHLIAESRARGYRRLSLETGSGAAFAPAALLFAKFGFDYCGPFGHYGPNPFSRFMTLTL
ncbi:MAG: GNAT family N-acetyltransferase [Woeseiaceae bacterium]|nr:GNAT family N-acetyltransferase [Woeseiaceae bacterium]